MKSGRRLCGAAATILLGMMVLGYLAAAFCIDLSVTPSFYTTDMYADVMVSVEMWEQKTLFPSNWVFGNQLYVFATPVLSSLIYGITGNAFRSMGAAAFLMGVLVLASFFWMLGGIFPKVRERLFALVAFLVMVVLFGDAVLTMNGWQLFFTMCAYYACYAISAFLTFGCYLRSETKCSPVMTVLACLLSFAMGIQSLRQTAVMVLPLLAMEAWEMLSRVRRKEPVRSNGTVIAVSVSATNAFGLICSHFLQVNQYTIFGKWDWCRCGSSRRLLWTVPKTPVRCFPGIPYIPIQPTRWCWLWRCWWHWSCSGGPADRVGED